MKPFYGTLVYVTKFFDLRSSISQDEKTCKVNYWHQKEGFFAMSLVLNVVGFNEAWQ